MEPVYESWAINRIVYSRVAATGFLLPEGKTKRRNRHPSQAGAAVNTHREEAHTWMSEKIFLPSMLTLVITASSTYWQPNNYT